MAIARKYSSWAISIDVGASAVAASSSLTSSDFSCSEPRLPSPTLLSGGGDVDASRPASSDASSFTPEKPDFFSARLLKMLAMWCGAAAVPGSEAGLLSKGGGGGGGGAGGGGSWGDEKSGGEDGERSSRILVG